MKLQGFEKRDISQISKRDKLQKAKKYKTEYFSKEEIYLNIVIEI
jgi:hypothetical protein